MKGYSLITQKDMLYIDNVQFSIETHILFFIANSTLRVRVLKLFGGRTLVSLTNELSEGSQEKIIMKVESDRATGKDSSGSLKWWVLA